MARDSSNEFSNKNEWSGVTSLKADRSETAQGIDISVFELIDQNTTGRIQ